MQMKDFITRLGGKLEGQVAGLRRYRRSLAKKRLASRSTFTVVVIAAGLGALIVGFTWAPVGTKALNHSASTGPVVQGTPRKRNLLHSLLSVQPEANKMRFRLGQRFLRPGREVAIEGGVLTIGTDRQQIRITRTQDDADGEQVTVAAGTGPPLTWSAGGGAKSNGRAATTAERTWVERIALDSPDQFILAQTRAASYYTLARQARPEEAPSDYSGPVWDIVRVAELANASNAAPESPYRLYYINSQTGLIEKIFSKEQGRTVVAELTGWTRVGEEMTPVQFAWRIDKQVVMELTLTGVSHGPR